MIGKRKSLFGEVNADVGCEEREGTERSYVVNE